MARDRAAFVSWTPEDADRSTILIFRAIAVIGVVLVIP
jgi:hypothetical protein